METVKNTHKTAATGIALLAPAYCGLLLYGTPRLLCPFPTITILPAFILLSAGLEGLAVEVLAILVPTILFFLWNPELFRGQTKFPIRSLVLLAILTVLTPIYFVGSWSLGLHYQGPKFTYGTCAANIAWLLALWAIFILARSKASFSVNLLAHFLLFTWLAWYAFPYLGELP
ncbi:MAG TPA: hypothetical protein VJW55_16020 [Candidatus Angelobacter sp.]|nr:hypothetical protein [Candidatus Angelobacter sp.]